MKRGLLTILISLLWVQFAGAEQVNKAFRLLDRGKTAKATEMFEDAIKDDSSDYRAHYGLYLTNRTNAEVAYLHLLEAEVLYKAKGSPAESHAGDYQINMQTITKGKHQLENVILNQIVEKGSVRDLRNYLLDYSSAHNTELARRHLRALTFRSLKKAPKLDSLNSFIDKHPEAEETKEAMSIRDSLAFLNAKKTNTSESYSSFIRDYPNARQVAVATELRDERAFQEAVKLNNLEAFDAFVKNYPKAKQVEQAVQIRNDLSYIRLLENEKELDAMKIKEQETKNKFYRKDLEVKKNAIFAISAGAGILALAIVLAVIAYFKSKKANVEISRQKDIIEEKNDQIIDSINYAKLIQSAMIPNEGKIQQGFKDAFVFYKPKDIVSGDFYWYGEKDGKKVVAAVDCTGHGVPGAFMSMMGNTLLNQIVLREKITEPDQILNRLRTEVVKSLNGSTDGMDIALCVLDGDKLRFAGAYNPMVLVKDGVATRVKADRMPIGKSEEKQGVPFKTQEITLEKDEVFYLFSDGFQDQFGGEDDKKFGSKRFRNFLQEIHNKPAQEQKEALASAFTKWQGETPQTDDVLVIGVKA